MKQYTIFGITFCLSFLFMVIFSETIWAIPVGLAGMIICFLCGKLGREMKLMQLVRMDGICIEVYNAELTDEEIKLYIDRARLAKPGAKLIGLTLVVEGEDVDITSEYEATPFERIRRITGYLVGRLGKANNAKQSEIADRTTNPIDRDLEDVLAEVGYGGK